MIYILLKNVNCSMANLVHFKSFCPHLGNMWVFVYKLDKFSTIQWYLSNNFVFIENIDIWHSD